MDSSDYEIPAHRLPEGFRDTLGGEVGEPVLPRPAATVVILRDGHGSGPEVLLLKRNRQTGFVPGAYVFPGGRVDRSDGDPEVTRYWADLDAESAQTRLALPAGAGPNGIAYFTAAVREVFEETGLLLSDRIPTGGSATARLAEGREALMERHGSFLSLLADVNVQLAGARIEYIAHWVTPEVEPRRYDTRFFAALVPTDAEVRIDEREMTAAEWLTPEDALARHEEGTLPMIFPTIRTLEDLVGFGSADQLLADFRERPISMIMPEIVRTEGGVALRIRKEP